MYATVLEITIEVVNVLLGSGIRPCSYLLVVGGL